MTIRVFRSKFSEPPNTAASQEKNNSTGCIKNVGKNKKMFAIALTSFIISSLFMGKITDIVALTRSRNVMRISVDFGHDGVCEWTEKNPKNVNIPQQIAFVSYPGLSFEVKAEKNLKEILVGSKKFLFSDEIFRWKMTHYPHTSESSKWVSGDEVIYFLRNPRWAIPAYYDSLYHTYASESDWVQWRDTHFNDEIRQWAGHINYYLEQGWNFGNTNSSREHPFMFHSINGTRVQNDIACITRVDCYPKAIVVYEKMRDGSTSSKEASKIAAEMFKNGKAKETSCFYNETVRNANFATVQRSFTLNQMNKIYDTLTVLRDKYQSLPLATKPVADLISTLHEYIHEINVEKEVLQLSASVETE